MKDLDVKKNELCDNNDSSIYADDIADYSNSVNGEKRSAIIRAVICVLIACVCFFFVAGYMAQPEHHKAAIKSLDDKKINVLELATASAVASTAITLTPGDIGNPIANELAQLSSDFVVILAAIFLEKYLLTVLGFAAFKFIVPIGLLILAINQFYRSEAWRKLALKLVVFGVAISMVIPCGILLSDMIEETYQESITQTIEEANNITEEISGESIDTSELEDAETKNKALQIIENLTNKFEEGAEAVTNAGGRIVAKANGAISNFIEAFAVMLVTSCLIPLLVIAFALWICNLVLGVNIDITSIRRHRKNFLTRKK